jgi:hypothetical protein
MALGHVHRAFRRKKLRKAGTPNFAELCPYLTRDDDDWKTTLAPP